MPAIATFLFGLLLLILFGWYIFSDAERAKRIVGSVLAVLLIAFCLQLVYPPFDVKDSDGKVKKENKGKISLGLDLRGGTSFLIRLAPAAGEKGEVRSISKDMVEQAMEAIRKRVDSMGVSEPVITPEGTDRILVQIPGLEEEKINDARNQLKQVAKLEFRLVNPQGDRIMAGQAPWDTDFVKVKEKVTRGTKTEERDVLVHKKPDVTGDHVNRAAAVFGQKGWEIVLGFDSVGAQLFGDLTAAHVNEQFAIMLDGLVITAPNINEPIRGGSASITGQYEEKDARALSSALNNPLQTPVTIEEQHSTSSTLGAEAIHSGVTAGIGGLVLVLLFVVLYYRFAGLVAILGLVVNILLLFGVMVMFGFVLTLPGIAGIILTIGLAVDANVLIYERLREELDAGKPLPVAINSAYDKAFTVIFDANATTLITAAILFWQASGPVKGFAVSLTVGVIASVFSAMVVTRVIFSWALYFDRLKSIRMMHIIPTGRNFNFLGKRFLWIGVSLTVILLSVVVFATRGERNFGIDFKGGDLVYLSSMQPVSVADVRSSVEQLHLGETVILSEKAVGSDRELISIRCPVDTSRTIEEHLFKTMPEAGFKEARLDKVGSVVGKELARGSLYAFGLGVLGILAYVTLRFEFAFAVGAIVALLHDVIITVGVFALAGKELSLVMVGAILTIAGYSINDTIVVYDRIREGLKAGRRGSVQDIMNASINETLSRTLLTSGCTFLSVAALYLFGGPVLHDFAFAILVGVVVGTYSSIFIASPIVLWWSGHKGHKLRSELSSGDERRTA